DITYRLHVSVWGDAEHSVRLRGTDVLSKAVRNYRGDDRALFVYTVTNKNIDRIMPVAALMADNGLDLTFNYYIPTGKYLSKLAASAAHDDEYFRFSSADDNLLLKKDDLSRAHDAIAAAQA